jgi:hypothetical protein
VTEGGHVSPAELTGTSRPRRAETVIAVGVGPELVLHETVSNGLHRLNPVGAEVWARLDGSRSLAELGQDIGEVYGVGAAEAEDAVVSLVRDLGRIGLLEGVAGDLVVDQMALFLGFRQHDDHDGHDHDGHDHDGHDHDGHEAHATGEPAPMVAQSSAPAPRYFAVPPSG